VSVYGLLAARDAATFNNAAFAGLHVTVLLAGAWPALRRPSRARTDPLPAAARGLGVEAISREPA
jgi:hypothetical protein